MASPLIGGCWSSSGDPGANPATHFLGTADAQPLLRPTWSTRPDERARRPPRLQSGQASPTLAE